MELSLDQFYTFLGQVEKCKAYLDLIAEQHEFHLIFVPKDLTETLPMESQPQLS